MAIELSNIAAGSGGFVINGQCGDDRSGYSLASAGDVNGDGLDDLIVGAWASDPAGGSSAGRTYVVFGQTGSAAIDLSAVASGSGGFVINGECANDQSGFSVAGAGDVNGDGLADLIVGAYLKDLAAGSAAGRSYVIFGQSAGGTVNLSAVANGSGGFVINGECATDQSGRSVAGAGDVNGDGLADLIIGARYSSPASGDDAGRSYVVFGQTGTGAINLSDMGAAGVGFVINGQCASDQSGWSVGSAGDVNGDGLADLIIGAKYSDPVSGISAGRSYVVFGTLANAEINLSAVANGVGGFVINGQNPDDVSGASVASAGDVNGDGLADLIVGSPFSDPATGSNAGHSYVVFGQSTGSAIDLLEVAYGNGGFVIYGECANDQSGSSVASAGDFNGDGLADLIIGARYHDPASGLSAGRSYVVFGQTTGGAINLGDVANGNGGFVINGQCALDQSGTSVASAGDVNGDGLADLIVGAPFSDPAAGSNAGRSYVIFGGTSDAFSSSHVDQMGTTNDDILTGSSIAETLVGNSGNDTLIGNGGADVLYGGSGNDSFELNADNVAQLTAGFNETFARIDGGSGIDTLAIQGSGIALNLSAVTNQGGASPAGGSRIESIEHIELSVGGNNTLTLTSADVIDMAGMNLFNTSNGWSGLGASVLKHQLVVDGHAGDSIELIGGTWARTGTATHNGLTYRVYDSDDRQAQVLVAVAVTTNVPAKTIELGDIAGGAGGFVINGQCMDDNSGNSVSSAGDVNGDGLDDLLIGAHYGSPAAGSYAGRSYVVFGQATQQSIELSAIANGSGGFVINGQCELEWSGFSVAGAGDTNGDGLADLIIGAYRSTPYAGNWAGRSYVVYGKTGGNSVDLSAVANGNGGFVINGQCVDDISGFSVASAGDVNGDGLADLIVGAPYASTASDASAGMSYVVFGKPSGGPVELSAIADGQGGFVINGQGTGDESGFSVAGAGDVNGDGLADLIVGALKSDTAAASDAGRSYVIFGKTTGNAIDLSAVANGSGGFVINGQNTGDHSGNSVAGAGDVNGDGLADLIVGAVNSNATGRSYVVFGKATGAAINLSAVADGIGGFVINGESSGDSAGMSVAGINDINGDGLADLLVGAFNGDTAGNSDAGRSYVVFGKTSGSAIDLTAVANGNDGFVISGQCAYDQSGRSVASAGDVNGDGLSDLIIGANASDTSAGNNAGRSYVIFGSTTGAFNSTAVDQMGGTGNDIVTGSSLSETLVAGSGSDSLIGNGGADVLYGGAGDDRFELNVDNIAKLGVGVTQGNYARIDGGSGMDTLALSGGGIALNPTSRIESIERIELTGSGNNTLALAYSDVLDMSGVNIINSSTQAVLGWSNGSYRFAASEGRHQLIVDGNAGDAVTLSSVNWSRMGTVVNGGDTYTVYNSDTGFAQVLLANAVASSVQNSDTAAPTVSNFSPADQATDIAVDTDVVITFNEYIQRGSGQIVLTDASGTTLVTYDASSSNLSIHGSTLTLNPDTNLDYNAGYKVLFAAGAIKDLAGNAYAGTTSYDFTTQTQNNHAPQLMPGGSLDRSFDGDGTLTTQFTSFHSDDAHSLAVQPDGKILVAGSTSNPNANDFSDFALARFNSDGSLDASFAGDGKVSTDFTSAEGSDQGWGVVLQSDGKIVVTGSTHDGFALARYNSDGSLDAGFGVDGKVTTGIAQLGGVARNAVIQADGKILVAGYGSGDVSTLARYNPNGSLDASFDGDGIVSVLGNTGMSMTLQSDGKILLAGAVSVGTDDVHQEFALARFNSDGSLDTSFSSDGMLTTKIGDSSNGASVLVQSDGKILVAGTSYSLAESDFAVARYTSSGDLDASFDGDGMLTTAIGAADDTASSIALQSDDKILLSGISYRSDGTSDFALVRYQTNGSLDTSFDGDGIKTTEILNTGIVDNSMAVASDGRILVAGTSSSHFAVVRYLPGGISDQTAQGYTAFSFTPPINTFNDADPGDSLTWSATLADGSQLPGWLNFDPATHMLSGEPSNENLGGLAIKVTVTDSGGLSSSDSFTLTVAPNHTILGSSGHDILYGTPGADFLDGGIGNDTLIGGLGNDSYVVDNAGDRIVETSTQAGEIDVVNAALSWTLSANLENLTLTGTGKFSGRGNGQSNILTGNDAANVLDGGAGADSLIGGAGNDIYVVDNLSDVIQENQTDAAEIDSVRAWRDWTLGDNLENLTLLGVKPLHGSGNALDNSLTGNGNTNSLDGGAGNDTLDGASGNDKLTGGAGSDTFAFTTPLNAIRNVDTVTDFSSGTDKLQFSPAIFRELGFSGAPSTDTFFHAGSTAHDADDRIVYDQANGALYYDADGTGALAAVQFALLSGAPTLLYTDFVVG